MNKYRSKLEKEVALKLGPGWDYEQEQVDYFVPHTYLVDFSKGNYLIEVKGFFRAGDQKKYLSIRESLAGEDELIFIFSNPNKKVRKNTKLTMGEWATRKGFRWWSVNDIKEMKKELKV